MKAKIHAWDILAASEADAQRRRLNTRAKTLPTREMKLSPAYRICVVVGGRGRCRALAVELAPLIGHASLEAGAPIDTVDRIRAASMGRFPRVFILAPRSLAGPIVEEIRARNQRYGLGWPDPVDLLIGLRSRDREGFLRLAVRTLKQSAAGASIKP